jgi:hypothetical protein
MRGQSWLQQSSQKTDEYVGSMELPVEGRPRHELYHAPFGGMPLLREIVLKLLRTCRCSDSDLYCDLLLQFL